MFIEFFESKFNFRFGRKISVFLCVSIAITSGVVNAFSVNIGMFMFLRFISGMANIAIVTVAFVLCKYVVTLFTTLHYGLLKDNKSNINGNLSILDFVTCLVLELFIINNKSII